MSLTDRLIRTGALAGDYLEGESRRSVIRFVCSKWNSDGGVCGRDSRSDLYYTVFGALCLRALGGRIPIFRLYFFLRSYGIGDGLDAIHLFSLIRLRSYFPMSSKTRAGLNYALEQLNPDSAYDTFFKVVTADFLGNQRGQEEPVSICPQDPTTNIAAAVVVNNTSDSVAERVLLERCCSTGGFCVTDGIDVPDLLSTATALFALKTLGVDMTPIRESCFSFIESLWRESGGFAGHEADQFEDVEYTYYALLSIGCLME